MALTLRWTLTAAASALFLRNKSRLVSRNWLAIPPPSRSSFYKVGDFKTSTGGGGASASFLPSSIRLLSFPIFLPFVAYCEEVGGGGCTSTTVGTTVKCSCDQLFIIPPNKCGPLCGDLPPSPPPPADMTAATGSSSPQPQPPPPTDTIITPPSTSPNSPPPPPTPTPAKVPNKNGLEPMNWCETTDLSHKCLVRQACQGMVDSVSRILCETVAAYQDYHEKYRCLLDAMIDALENSRSSDGVQLELLDCRIIMMRAEVDNMKGRILELECFMASIQRLSDATAETAYLGHAEYHSLAISERLDSAMREMKAIKEESARKERDMIELQSVVIVESGRGLK